MSHPIASEWEKRLGRFLESIAISATQSGLAQAISGLDEESSQRIVMREDHLRVYLKRATIDVLRQLSSSAPILVGTDLLKPVALEIAPARSEAFDADRFYRNKTGLFVSRGFRKCFDLKKVIDPTPERSYVALLLKDDANDTDVRKSLPAAHLSTLEDIAALFVQPAGKFGDGFVNLFYVEGKNGKVFAVSVLRDRGTGYWLVYGQALNSGDGWRAKKTRVLCPGCALL